jgi:hypothetical protein
MEVKMYPKKSRLVFNVGVTGHRDINFEESQCLMELSGDILKFISDAIEEIRKKIGDFYANEEPKLRLITCLAEGFDRITAHSALDLGYEIQCPLPFSRDEYSKDFQSSESKTEFYLLLQKAGAVYELDFGRSVIDKQYLNAGTILLEQTDILLAFWDGSPAKGPGGTGEIVEIAKEKSIPIIHINRNMEVLCENERIWKKEVNRAIRHLLIPYDSILNKNTFPYLYFNEKLENRSYAHLYDHIIKVFSPKRDKKINSEKKSPIVSHESKIKSKEKQYFEDFFKEADSLAIYYADYYRSAGVLRSLIPLLANISLAVGFYWRWGENSNIVNVIGFLFQAVFLYWMVRVVGKKNEKSKWHQKFIDYRILAECIKNQSYVTILGVTLRDIEISAYAENDSISWINWYLRNITRGIGLPNIIIDREIIEESIVNFNKELILDQMQYHKKSFDKISTVGKKLEKIGVLFFSSGALITVIRIVVHYACQINPSLIWLPNPGHKIIKLPVFINMLSLLLPAFGAVMFSLGAQAGFDKLAQRHLYMKDHLTNISAEIQRIKNESFITVRKKLFKVVTFMIDEVTDWRMFIKGKGISKR